MASHDISWVPGVHIHFGDLDFIITVGGELALAHAAIQPLPSIGLHTVDEVVEELQQHALGARTPKNNWLLDYERLERQLGISLGPQPSREDLRRLTFSYANNMAWLTGGEPPLSGTPHPERPDSASVRSPQRREDC